MIAKLKILLLINWREEGKWSLLHFLRDMVQKVDILQPFSMKGIKSSRLTYISNYLSEFYVPLMALTRRKQYDVIISWQMRLGICYGILKRIVHSGSRPAHIIQDFHIDLTKTNLLYRLQLGLLKLAIPGIDYFFCTSREEEEIYSRRFGIARNRIAFLPLMSSLSYFDEPDHPKKDYIFAFGYSDRDFDVLIRAVAGLDVKTCILSKKYQPRIPFPENVSIIRDRVSEKELIQWISASRMVVIPLKDYRVSAGQISMLEVMALARPLIITENMATKEYAVHNHSALFFNAGDDRELSEHIQSLLNNRETAESMGQAARQTAWEFKDKRRAVLSDFLMRCTTEKGESR